MNEIKKIFCIALFVSVLVFPSMLAISAEVPEIKVPDEIVDITEEIGQKYGCCPELLQSLIFYESTFQPDVGSSHKGLMQVSEKWHKDRMERLGVTDLYDPYQNILVGTDYLMELASEYESITYVLDLYHGDSNAEYNEENGVVSYYAWKILRLSEELEKQHGK